MKFLIALLLCFCGQVVGFAQSQEMPRRNCRECVITKTYQPVTKSTLVLLKPMSVADVSEGKMYFSLATSYNDSGIRRVVSVGVTFIAKQLIEAKDPALRAQADESAINLGRLAHSRTNTEAGLKISSYDGLADWEDVLKLGQCKRVDIDFDGIKFRLTDEHKAAILDFLAYGEGDP